MSSTKFNPGTFRTFSGYIRYRISKGNVEGMKTSIGIDEELWTILEYYSEVDEVGKKLIRDKGVPDESHLNKEIFLLALLWLEVKKFYLPK